MIAAEAGGAEVNLAILAATLVDVVDFFPVVFLYGVAKFLFSALALAFCLSLLASFVVAMTVIPLFCSRFLKAKPHGEVHDNREYDATVMSPSRIGQVQRALQPNVQQSARLLRALGAAGGAASRAYGIGFERRVPAQFGDLSAAGTGVLP